MFHFLQDDGAITVRTQSLDSLEPDDDEEKEISVLKKKKHRPLEESSEPSKKSEKLKRRQQIDQDSSQGKGCLIQISRSIFFVLKTEFL